MKELTNMEVGKMKLGEHPVTRRLLDKIVAEKIDLFRNLARKHGVPDSEVNEVIGETCLSVCKLAIKGEILQILEQWTPTPENSARLESALTALFVFYLKLKCQDYHRREKRRRQRETSFEQQFEGGFLPLLYDQSWRAVITELGPFHDLDLEKFAEGDMPTVLRFFEQLSWRAGLTPRETEFVLFRIQQPEALDQVFKYLGQSLSPAVITRLKQSAFKKILKFLGLNSENKSGKF